MARYSRFASLVGLEDDNVIPETDDAQNVDTVPEIVGMQVEKVGNDIEDTAVGVDNIITDANTVANVQGIVKDDLNANNGISETTAQVVDVVMESIYTRWGMGRKFRRSGRCYSQESFRNSKRSKTAAKVALEWDFDPVEYEKSKDDDSIWTKIWIAIKNFFKRVYNGIMYLFGGESKVTKIVENTVVVAGQVLDMIEKSSVDVEISLGKGDKESNGDELAKAAENDVNNVYNKIDKLDEALDASKEWDASTLMLSDEDIKKGTEAAANVKKSIDLMTDYYEKYNNIIDDDSDIQLESEVEKIYNTFLLKMSKVNIVNFSNAVQKLNDYNDKIKPINERLEGINKWFDELEKHVSNPDSAHLRKILVITPGSKDTDVVKILKEAKVINTAVEQLPEEYKDKSKYDVRSYTSLFLDIFKDIFKEMGIVAKSIANFVAKSCKYYNDILNTIKDGLNKPSSNKTNSNANSKSKEDDDTVEEIEYDEQGNIIRREKFPKKGYKFSQNSVELDEQGNIVTESFNNRVTRSRKRRGYIY